MLLFSLGVVISVELSLACNIHIGDNERGKCISDVSTVYVKVIFIFSTNGWSNPEVFILKLSAFKGG